MKKAFFIFLMLLCLHPALTTSANATHNNSLRFWLVLDQPLPGDIHPGGAVLIGTNAIFDPDETTVEAWFKPTSYATGTGEDEGRTILWNGDGTAGHDPYWIYIDQYGYLVARVAYESPYQGQIIKSANPVSLNVWHHFALVISLTETSLYLDGVK